MKSQKLSKKPRSTQRKNLQKNEKLKLKIKTLKNEKKIENCDKFPSYTPL